MNWVKHPVYNIYANENGDVKWTVPRKLRLSRSGYYRFNVKHGDKIKTLMVHRVVADCFLGQMPDVELTVNHKNGNKLDNRASNLEYIYADENTKHAFQNGLVGTCHPVVHDGVHYYSKKELYRTCGYSLRKQYQGVL